MDNKKRLELIKKHAAASQSARDLQAPEVSKAVHGLSPADSSAGHHESVEATKDYAAALEKHLPGNALKAEHAALQSAPLHQKNVLESALTRLENALQKKIVETHHLPEEAAAYMLLVKLSAFSRAILFAEPS